MVVLETVCVAFAMFSALPVPHVDWNERNMRYAMAAFPLVGAVIGALWCVCGLLPLPDMLKAAGFCLIPVAATGGIHLDGFADTSDALSSYGDREKKLAILKDPHCGAFAVIRLCGYFVLYFALCACLRFTPRVGAVWTLALVLERALSGYAVATFPMAKNTGLAHTFATAADKRRVQIVLLAVSVCVGAGMALLGRRAACAGGAGCPLAVSRRGGEAVRRHYGRSGGLVFAARRACHAGGTADFGGVDRGDFHHGAAVQRQADVRRETRRAADFRRAESRGSGRRFGVAGGRAGGGLRRGGGDGNRRAALCRWTRASGARGRRPGGWPACWRRARTR